MTILEQAQAIREAMDFAGATLDDEQALICVHLYRPWGVGREYKVGDFLTYGTNSVGDPQLYKVVLDHTSQADWLPPATPSLYDAVGLDEEGYPVWSQSTGSHDAYNKGDIVNYNGVLYKSLIDGNTYSPEAYPAGWEVYE
jgi:hypothetical protein